jgi:uracil-DNA glycosylase
MNQRRLRYLQALEIDVWQRRAASMPQSASATVAVVEALTPVAPPDPPVAKPSFPSSPGVVDGLSRSASHLDWAALEQRVRQCTACELHRTRTLPVFGVGNRQARWMVIGEAPGADEDKQGEPFVGRAGQLLNSMLKAMGLAREQVYIANILKSRPPGNRDPKPEEVSACIGYLYRQIELVDPVLLLCVGRIAAQTLLNTDTPIGKLRGKLHALETGAPTSRPLIVTYHPAYLLRSPAEKRKAWSDLVLAMQTFEQLSPAVENSSNGERAAATLTTSRTNDE